jgi:hypothetical protein
VPVSPTTDDDTGTGLLSRSAPPPGRLARMGIRQWTRDHSMKEPVAGTFKVTSTDRLPGAKTVITGVLTGPGLEPTPAQHTVDVPLKKIAAVYRRIDLPVLVDRADPSRLRFIWDDVPDEKQLDLMQAAQVAERMRRQSGGSGYEPTHDGDPPDGFQQPDGFNTLFDDLANGRNVRVYTSTTTSTTGDLPPEIADLAQRVAEQFGRAFGAPGRPGQPDPRNPSEPSDTMPWDEPPRPL